LRSKQRRAQIDLSAALKHPLAKGNIGQVGDVTP